MQAEFNRFLNMSRTANGIEMGEVILKEIREQLHGGISLYDAHLNEEVLLISSVFWIRADNPFHAEMCGGEAGNGSLNLCRFCYVRPTHMLRAYK